MLSFQHGFLMDMTESRQTTLLKWQHYYRRVHHRILGTKTIITGNNSHIKNVFDLLIVMFVLTHVIIFLHWITIKAHCILSVQTISRYRQSAQHPIRHGFHMHCEWWVGSKWISVVDNQEGDSKKNNQQNIVKEREKWEIHQDMKTSFFSK